MQVAEHEASFLREHYATRGSNWCAQQLGLTWRQVQNRKSSLGLYQKREWTQRDDDMLRYHWGARPIRLIAKDLNRTPAATYERAKKLDLGLGCPRGYVYLSQLAHEAGFSTASTRHILKWANVRLVHGPKNPTSVPRGRGHRNYVTWVVDHVHGLEAIERWLETETLFAAAKRVGVCAGTLAKWLTEDGRAGPRPAHRKRWYISTALVTEIARARLA